MAKPAGGPKPIEHPCIRALLAANPGETDPKALIRRLARAKVDYAKAQRWNGPPFCPKVFASIFGIRCKEVQHEIKSDGRILPYPGGRLWIEYRMDRPKERQRFTIFHEFAHTLFPNFCEFVPHHHNPPNKVADPDKPFENLCDIAAAEMLMPVADFRGHMAADPAISCEVIQDLSARYEASPDATMLRFIELTENIPCAAAFLTDQKGQYSGDGPLWVQYCRTNSHFRSYFPTGTTPPRNSVSIRCLRDGQAVTFAAAETWRVGRYPRTWLVQAMKLPIVPDNPFYPKVVALFLPTGYKPARA